MSDKPRIDPIAPIVATVKVLTAEGIAPIFVATTRLRSQGSSDQEIIAQKFEVDASSILAGASLRHNVELQDHGHVDYRAFLSYSQAGIAIPILHDGKLLDEVEFPNCRGPRTALHITFDEAGPRSMMSLAPDPSGPVTGPDPQA